MTKWKKRSVVCAFFVCALVISLGTTQALPDLVVNSITPNCGGYLFANEGNELSAMIENVGDVDASAFNVTIAVDGYSERVSVPSLAAGNSTTVSITDPTIRAAGTTVTIAVTADADTEITESDETNNTLELEKTVVNNGYKGKRYTGGSDITAWQTFELPGDLLYSTGDSQYLSGSSTPWTTYTVNWNASDLPVPAAASLQAARLYVFYTWEKVQVMPDTVSLSLNGNAQTLDAFFTDRKGYASSDYPYGMLAYTVTTDFSTAGNTAILTNLNPVAGNPSLRGMVLVVIYEDATELMKKITLNEGFDLLYGGASACTTPEEATAYAPFAGSVELNSVRSARLITVAPGAGPNEGELLFNGQTWTDVWNYAGTSQIGIDDRDVTALLASTNEAGFQSSGDYMEASNAFLVVEMEYERPDLLVTALTPNCGGYLFANQSNEIQAVIANTGDAEAGAFNVTIAVDGYSERVTVPSLAAGNSTTVSITDPTIRAAGTAVTIAVTADAEGDINESDEANNTLQLEKTVVNNGYNGKRYTGGSDITTWQTFELPGDLLYSTGDSQYLSGSSAPWTTYAVNWTASDLLVPAAASLEAARLYVFYTWEKVQVMPDTVSLNFNGMTQTRDAFYTDRKGYASSDYPYGMLAYDVTTDFSTAGNTAILTNLNPVAGNPSLRGMVLVVIYEDATELMKKITLNEGFDLLYGGPSACTTPEDATAYAPFAGSVALSTVRSARLITVAPGGGPDEGELLFNGQTWTDVWNYAGISQIGIDERDVTAYMAATNEAGFQSSGDYMEASTAFLVVEYEQPAPTPTPVVRRGGGGGTPKDSDGDGYSDIEELLQGTNSSDPNDYPGAVAAPVTPAPATPTSPPATPVPTPVPTPTPAPATPAPATPTPEQPGFEAVFTIGGLVALTYLTRRKKGNA
ncbi:MAG: DUF3344 domain-containing protein [Candidatus Methanospirareceae archaeon]